MMHEMIRVGDRVRMKMDSEARSWGRKGQPDDTEGAVVGFYRYKTAYSRFGLDLRLGRKPGIYEKNGEPLVLWDGQKNPETVSGIDLIPVDELRYNERYKKEWVNDVLSNDKVYKDIPAAREAYFQTQRVGDLPETKYFELDKVTFDSGRQEEYGIVLYINYPMQDKETISYAVSLTDENFKGSYGQMTVPEKRLKLIERGNVWRHYNNEPLIFSDLKEEASFEKDMGRSVSVRNPESGHFGWTLVQALEAIKSGHADAIEMSQSFFGKKNTLYMDKFSNTDLGQRLREETLKGFEGARFDASGELITDDNDSLSL